MSEIPAAVAALRAELTDHPEYGQQIVNSARSAALASRWALTGLPAPGHVPYAAERFAGKPFRWLAEKPPTTDGADEHRLDEHGRVVITFAPGPREHCYRYSENAVERATVINDEVTELARTSLCDRRPIEYVEASHDTWIHEEYRYGTSGLIDEAYQRFTLAGVPGLPAGGIVGGRTDILTYAPNGALIEVRTTFDGQAPRVTYHHRQRAAKTVVKEFAGDVRSAILTSLRTTEEPSSIRAVCVLYDQLDPTNISVVVKRDPVTIAGTAPDIALNPAEWHVPDTDWRHLDLPAPAEFSDPEQAHAAGPKALELALEQLAPHDLASALQIAASDLPVTYLMDLGLERAPTIAAALTP